MNTATSPIATATLSGSSVSTLNPAISSTEQDIANLRAQLEEAQTRKAHLLEEEAQNRAKVRRDAILGLPSILGVVGLPDVIVLIRREMAPANAAAKGSAKRAFPNALSDETKAQMKAMLEAGATSRSVAESCKVGLSTVDSWKAKWGLTHKSLGGRPAIAPRTRTISTKRRKGGQHFSPAKKARIIAALQKPNAVISLIARREHVSRQACYDLRAREHLVAA